MEVWFLVAAEAMVLVMLGKVDFMKLLRTGVLLVAVLIAEVNSLFISKEG